MFFDFLSLIPGVGPTSEAIAGHSIEGEKLSGKKRALKAAQGVGEVGLAFVGSAGEGRLTTSQATDLAEYLGFKRVKNTGFSTHGRAVFSDGKRMISYDVDGHRGVWKMLNPRTGQRVATYDALLTGIVGN